MLQRYIIIATLLHLSCKYFQIVLNTKSNAQRTHTFAIHTSQPTNQKLQKSVPYPPHRREKKSTKAQQLSSNEAR